MDVVVGGRGRGGGYCGKEHDFRGVVAGAFGLVEASVDVYVKRLSVDCGSAALGGLGGPFGLDELAWLFSLVSCSFCHFAELLFGFG